ncbi:MAG: S-adenosylmethionine decarboxylase [Acidobacteria bacterium]|nr:S-adenosylmethionine decarboxylase [Acidobacteriota bacterium]
MSFVGTEWIVDAVGCRAEALADAGILDAVFRRVVAELNLKAVGEAQWHKFPEPGGVTGLLMLTESHLACHTYPEHGVATFNLYCCRARPEWPWVERLTEMLGASKVTVRVCERPATAAQESFDESEAHIIAGKVAGDINEQSGGGARR